MMKVVVLFSNCFFFFLCSNLHSQNKEKELYLETGLVFLTSSLNWSIAGDLYGNSPNILSELKFNNIVSIGTYFKGKYYPIKSLRMSTYFHQSNVIKGRGSDTDYKDDNRTNPTFEKSFSSNKGNFTKMNAGIGFPINLSDKIEIIPSIIYNHANQKFYLLNSDIKDLRSKYQVTMEGAGISLEGNIKLNKIIYSSLTLSHYIVNYIAKADWNLIDIFKHPLSFSQTSKGSGLGLNIEFGIDINKTFSVIADGTFNTVTIGKGIDTSYLITEKEIFTQFNGAKNSIFSLKLGFYVSF